MTSRGTLVHDHESPPSGLNTPPGRRYFVAVTPSQTQFGREQTHFLKNKPKHFRFESERASLCRSIHCNYAVCQKPWVCFVQKAISKTDPPAATAGFARSDAAATHTDVKEQPTTR
jgi:hypothetical protein